MPHSSRLLLAVSGVAMALAAAACASGGGASDGAPYTGASVRDRGDGPAVPPAAAVKAGWRDLRSLPRNVVTTITFVNHSSPEGQALLAGRNRVTDAKILEDAEAAHLVSSFEATDFAKYAVAASPDSAPSNALGVVWLESGGSTRSLFLVRGAGSHADSAAAARVYQDLKILLLSLDQTTTGFRVTTGTGDGDPFQRPPPGGRR